MTGSLIIFALFSTYCEYSRPMATCLSSEYQLPKPLLQPTLRLPMALMSFIESVEGLFLSPLSGAYCPSEELWSEDEELCAMPNGTSINASMPTEKKRIVERMLYTFKSGPDLPF
jgi:hypothetical protein